MWAFRELSGFNSYEDALKDKNFKELTNNKKINMILFTIQKIKITENAEKLNIPATFNQIDKIVVII